MSASVRKGEKLLAEYRRLKGITVEYPSVGYVYATGDENSGSPRYYLYQIINASGGCTRHVLPNGRTFSGSIGELCSTLHIAIRTLTKSTPKRKPWESNGSTCCWMPDGTKRCTGSQMGRSDILPVDPEKTITLRMERLRFIDGCYDKGGAYWGLPENLYCAYGEDEEVQVQIFVRAESRMEAKKKVRASIPGAHFYR